MSEKQSEEMANNTQKNNLKTTQNKPYPRNIYGFVIRDFMILSQIVTGF